jgi:hypothetical protein
MRKWNRDPDPEKTRDQVEREDKEEHSGMGEGTGESTGATMGEGTNEMNRE